MRERIRIGVVTPVCPYGHHGGHASRTRRIVEVLAEKHDVWVLFAPFRAGSAPAEDRQVLGPRLLEYPRRLYLLRRAYRLVASRLGLYRARPLDRRNIPLRRLAPAFLAGVVARYARQFAWDAVVGEYVFLTPAFDKLPKTVSRVMDTHDLFANRFDRVPAGVTLPWPWCVASLDPGAEASALMQADAVLAIQAEEAGDLRARGVAHCSVVPHLPDLTRRAWESGRPPAGETIAYFGSEWAPNVQGLEWFIAEVLPLVRQQVPGVVLRVAGGAGRGLSPAEGVEVVGFVDDVRDFLSLARAVICPVFFGTGLNIKVVETLGWGLPLVATPMAYRGLDRAAFPGIPVSDDPVATAATLVGLLRSDEAALALAGDCRGLAESIDREGRGALARALGTSL